jgi:hypothetical protein
MAVVALVTWLVTAVLGFFMLAKWVAAGALRDGGTPTRFAPALVFGHFLLAAAGLVVWIIFLVNEAKSLAWLAFGLLVVVAVLGDVLFVRWWRGRGESTVESGLPKPVVYGHGLLAVTTAVLVLITALI